MSDHDYYELLGIDATANQEDIEAGYRRAAQYWHPDRNKAPNASQMMGTINEARDVLADEDRRAEYDANRRSSHNREYPSERDTSRSRSSQQSKSGGQAADEGQSVGPDQQSGEIRWHFGGSTVRIDATNLTVVGWDNSDGNLNVPPQFQSRGNFTIGSTQQQVVDVQGPPSRIEDWSSIGYIRLHYEKSWVQVDPNSLIVTSWDNAENNLIVSDQLDSGATFTIGSTQRQVVELQGAPDRVEGSDGSVGGFVSGSTQQQVITAQGTPDRIEDWSSLGYLTMRYGRSWVRINAITRTVEGWDNAGNNLVARD